METAVSIVDDAFYINGEITYPGRSYQGNKVEGLLINTRMVQGIFDDRNPETVHLWKYPDTGAWDPERNTREFLSAMAGVACSRRVGVHNQSPRWES